MKKVILTLAAASIFNVLQAQQVQEFTRTEVSRGSDDNGSWTVRKSFDKDGKMTAYDSSYTQKGSEMAHPFEDLYSDSTFQGLGRRLDRGMDPLFGEGWTDSLGLGALSQRFFNEENWAEASEEFNQLFEELNKMQQQLLEQFQQQDQNGQVKENDWEQDKIDM